MRTGRLLDLSRLAIAMNVDGRRRDSGTRPRTMMAALPLRALSCLIRACFGEADSLRPTLPVVLREVVCGRLAATALVLDAFTTVPGTVTRGGRIPPHSSQRGTTRGPPHPRQSGIVIVATLSTTLSGSYYRPVRTVLLVQPSHAGGNLSSGESGECGCLASGPWPLGESCPPPLCC